MPSHLKVVSKYFSSKIGMDDSLSDFKEEKKYNTGPNNPKKTTNKNKLKSKRGQKDIRSLIKKQENGVLLYSKEFDKVCKNAGVDVDSEELQLAIALSKSLHDLKKENNTDLESKSSDQLTSRQRTLKIKRTLQEYGFKVPKIKITNKNKRKGYKKSFKLLLSSDEERQQIISDKYSEILARNIDTSPVKKIKECDYYNKELYYKATNITYKNIKSDNIYYVANLFDKPSHKTCMLRDWSEIPGRPVSPILEVKNIHLDDIVFDQSELDGILSGSICTAQQIVFSKSHVIVHNSITVENVQCKPPENKVDHTNNANDHKNSKSKLNTDCLKNNNPNNMSISHIRSISPDLFDDEVSAVMEYTDNGVNFSEQTKNENIHTVCYMDLTDCCNVYTCNPDFGEKTKVQINSETNITNRKSNDFMEITECVSTSSKEIDIEKIDLTQSSHSLNKQIHKTFSPNENIKVMDLTQSPDCDQSAEEINVMKNYIMPLDDTIIIVEDEIHSKLQAQKPTLSEYPQQNMCIVEINYDKIDLNSDKNKELISSSAFKGCFYNKSIEVVEELCEPVTKLVECQPDEIDLTQSSKLLGEQHILYDTCLGKKDNVSIDYDEVNENNSTSLPYDYHIYENNPIEKECYVPNKGISLSISNLEVVELNKKKSNNSQYLHQAERDDSDMRCSTIMSQKKDFLGKDVFDSKKAFLSCESPVLSEISDKELSYSMHQSKHEHSDFRDALVMNEFENYEELTVADKNELLDRSNTQKEYSSLETIIKSQKPILNSGTPHGSSCTQENIRNVLHTPKNSEYIVKTSEITPMLDYASMSSPERHKELEKYGLKPFKRKRAIQLLTYLYDQTHPIVESHFEINPSPSKKQKIDNEHKSGCFSKSPCKRLDFVSKTSKAPVKHSVVTVLETDKENDWYAITNELPDVRNIECDAEDWFFQKKERSKVHSCRVPLHVAFHNYVSCRQRLREAILRYEPVNIDVIHKDLVATGYRYNPKDLLKFMDRKCITVKTADNNSRNRKS